MVAFTWLRVCPGARRDTGEMLYIPDRFYHAILNLGEAVAVIGELCAKGPGCNFVGETQTSVRKARTAQCVIQAASGTLAASSAVPHNAGALYVTHTELKVVDSGFFLEGRV
jgi:hypothetical protein